MIGKPFDVVTPGLFLGAAFGSALNSAIEAQAAAADARATAAVLDQWDSVIESYRADAARAFQIAEAAVDRVRNLEAEVLALRNAVAVRDNTIRALSHD